MLLLDVNMNRKVARGAAFFRERPSAPLRICAVWNASSRTSVMPDASC